MKDKQLDAGAALSGCTHPEGRSVSRLAVLPQPVHTLPGVTDHGRHARRQAQRAQNGVQLGQHA